MKIVIVGSDGRKFNKDQEEKAKATIYCIFARVALGKDLTKKQLKMVLEKDVTSFDYSNLTLVSGHCPVGKERWYCVDCESWIMGDGETAGFLKTCHKHLRGHRLVEVYDKGGIDTWAEIIAKKLGIETDIHPAETYQWKDKVIKVSEAFIPCQSRNYLKGYRSRNIDMAKIGTIGYTIEVAGSCRHCGGTGKQKKADEEGDGWYYDSRESCNKCKGTGAYSGGTFTINWMKKLGKETHQVIIE